ncbi:MAG: alpha/beta hydrolase [Deltaproteobacteria bacterium]|nr:MAG: alpha/beta hydrolase [Deltaproteobacteria bacterium]
MVTRPDALPTAVRRLYPFSSRYMDMGGLQYHYLDEGEGEPVIMVHGNPTWSFFYRNLITALSPGYRTIAPDHIGCGLSDKPSPSRYGYRLENRIADLTRFIDHLALDKKITLVVHDWGGMIGMAWAVDHIERIGRIVILNTAAFLPPGGKPLPWQLKLIRTVPLAAAGAVLGLNLFAVGATIMAPCRRLSRDVRAGFLAPYDRPGHRIATLRFVQDIPVTEKAPGYGIVARTDAALHNLGHLPMLICWGSHDFVFDTDYLAEWQRRFPHAEVHPFDDAGHYLLEDAPAQIIPLIQSFLQKHPV